MKIPVTVCLFTSTLGHFGLKTRYLETLNSLNSQIPLAEFAARVATIKVSPGEEAIGGEMEKKLQDCGFKVLKTFGAWSHQQETHQNGYLNSMMQMYLDKDVLKNPYSLHLEDDFILRPYKFDLQYYIYKAINILEEIPDMVQVRFPRFNNEKDRINGLKQKHNIDGIAGAVAGFPEFIASNDLSLNPSIVRPRDMKDALILMAKNGKSFPQHSEMGLSLALKYFTFLNIPFAFFDPELIRCGHIGCEEGKQDNLDLPLIST